MIKINITEITKIVNSPEFNNPGLRNSIFNAQIQDIYDEPADILCTEFYESHFGSLIEKPQVVYVTHGGQAAIYRCYTEATD